MSSRDLARRRSSLLSSEEISPNASRRAISTTAGHNFFANSGFARDQSTHWLLRPLAHPNALQMSIASPRQPRTPGENPLDNNQRGDSVAPSNVTKPSACKYLSRSLCHKLIRFGVTGSPQKRWYWNDRCSKLSGENSTPETCPVPPISCPATKSTSSSDARTSHRRR